MSKIVIKQGIYPWYIQRGEIMKKKKHLKIFAASSLALFMGIGILCGGMIFPIKNANLNVLNTENAIVTNKTLAEEIKSYKADIASGKIKYAPSPFGLDPANDPVIYTTSNGIEIKSSNAITNPNLENYLYLTLGTYNNYAINWLIVGMPRHVGDTNTPAGAAIYAEIAKNYYHTQAISGTTGVCYDSSLSDNNYRIISECTLGTTAAVTVSNSGTTLIYRADEGGNVYASYTPMNTTLTNYKTSLGLPTAVGNSLHYLTSTQANMFLNKIAYSIGTTTATEWWISGNAYLGGSNPGAYEVVNRPIYYSCINASGNLQEKQVGYAKIRLSGYGDYELKALSANDATSGVRIGAILTL